MPFETYVSKRFSSRDENIIKIANNIINEYQKQGYELTLRQLYYQFVARDILPNHIKMYKLLGNVINDARLAGLIDWAAIVDRTRELRGKQFWERPAQLVEAVANSFHLDRWEGQTNRPEVWIEKDALLGVFERICREWDINYFSCRGYTSQSEMWGAGRRILDRYQTSGQSTTIYHFGDRDPSGIDMSRDIEDRIRMFTENEEGCFDFIRIALNKEQVTRYKCPPNPAKLSDSRSSVYVKTHGSMSWELDALDPKVLSALVKSLATRAIDNEDLWEQREQEQILGRQKILKAAKGMK